TTGALSGTSNAFDVVGAVDHFKVIVPRSRFDAGAPFTVTAYAMDAANNVVSGYNSSASWPDPSGSITPGAPADFVNGVSTTPGAAIANASCTALFRSTSGAVSGTSSAFGVVGAVDHLQVIVPRSRFGAGAPFTVTAYAMDAANNVVWS